MNKIVPPQIQKLHETMSPAIQRINEVTQAFKPYISQLNQTMAKVVEHAQSWQEARKQDVTVIDNGHSNVMFSRSQIGQDIDAAMAKLGKKKRERKTHLTTWSG